MSSPARASLEGSRPAIGIVGAGPAGLIAAEMAAAGGAQVTVFERMPTVGRKFLLAGRGGLNLTHGEPFASFVTRYREAEPRLRAALEAFAPTDLRSWSAGLGQPTFEGTSGRIFPERFKTSPLLRAWLGRLNAAGVVIRPRHRWTGWTDEGALRFVTPEGETAHGFDAVVLALGGASWPHLGSDGGWTETLAPAGIAIAPLRPSNCGLRVAWSETFRARFEGAPIKSIALSFGVETARGDMVVTRAGLEGGPVYALSAPVRDAVAAAAPALLHVDLRPDRTADALIAKLARPRGSQSLSTWLKRALNLPPVALGLLQEAARAAGAPLADMAADRLARLIKAVPFPVIGTASIDRAISSAGGVRFDAIDEQFMLKDRPGVFVAGEMIDWEAPTGGYLLQATFATGVAAGRGALRWATRVRDAGP